MDYSNEQKAWTVIWYGSTGSPKTVFLGTVLGDPFATSQLDLIAANDDFLGNLLFSDESHFHLHGRVNHQNFRYLSAVNPHWYRKEPLHSPRVSV